MNVYSRNQNFTILNSCKFGKNTPLVISPLTMLTNSDNDVFFQSLICDKALIVNADNNLFNEDKKNMSDSKETRPKIVQQSIEYNCPDIDDFIKSLIEGGRIKKKTYHKNVCTNKPMIIYEISDFRYCSNVLRRHKGGI